MIPRNTPTATTWSETVVATPQPQPRKVLCLREESNEILLHQWAECNKTAEEALKVCQAIETIFRERGMFKEEIAAIGTESI